MAEEWETGELGVTGSNHPLTTTFFCQYLFLEFIQKILKNVNIHFTEEIK
jgi:hypothetical protein